MRDLVTHDCFIFVLLLPAPRLQTFESSASARANATPQPRQEYDRPSKCSTKILPILQLRPDALRGNTQDPSFGSDK